MPLDTELKEPIFPAENLPYPLDEHAIAAIQKIQSVEKFFPGAIIITNLKTGAVMHMSEWGTDFIGTSLTDLQQMGTEYHDRFFNPEDAKDYLPKLFDLVERNNDEYIVSFFQQVRRSPQHEWSWFLTAAKVFYRDTNGEPLLVLNMALPVDAQHHIAAKAERLLEENNFLRKNHHVFNTLTKREKEILRLMALGHSAGKIAQELFISEETASTHRRNIKKKLKIETNYDITRFAQAFDLV
jgi:DNA-binding CsgD family transcriptional regulator